MIKSDELRSIIENVNDPDLGISIGQLNAIDRISIENDRVEIKLKLIQPIYWTVESINNELIKELRKVSPNTKFEILITEEEFDTSEREVLPNVKNLIAVSSGKGGVGKSSIASNIASALSKKGARVGILDADIYGPSQPTMFGLKNAQMESVKMPDGKVMARPTTKYGIQIASMGFLMQQNDAAIVRGPMLAGYFSMLFEQIVWGNLDFLIFDLPPGTGDIQLTLTQKIPLTGAVTITTPQEIALADVRRSIAMFRKVNVENIGIIENMSWFSPPGSDEKYYIFGKDGGKIISEETNVELLGQVPLSQQMREGNDGGMPEVLRDENSEQSKEIIKITDNIVSKVRKINFEKTSTPEVEINI
ncbi:MAG: P-loop NTPase [Chlorobiota bacterium]